MKKIVSLLLVITFVFTLGGCFGEETEKVTPEDVKNRVISEATQYLKETYPDDEFTYISGRSPNWAYNYYEIGFSSKNYDDQLVTVYGDPDEEKETEDGLTVYNYYDDYYQYTMLEDAEKYFYDLAKPYFGDEIIVKVSFSTGIGFANDVTKAMDFKDYLSKKVGTLNIYFFYCSDEEINNLETFIDVLKYKCSMYCEFNKITKGYEEFVNSSRIYDIIHNSSECYTQEYSYIFDDNGKMTYMEEKE